MSELIGLINANKLSKEKYFSFFYDFFFDYSPPFKVIESKKGLLLINSNLFNWKELSKKLGLRVTNQSELVSKIFESFPLKKVIKLLNSLEGSYSLSYYYREKKELVLSCDWVGINSLHYFFVKEKNEFGFGLKKSLSEINPKVIQLDSKKVLLFQPNKKRVSFFLKETKFKKNASTKLIKNNLVEGVKKRIPSTPFGLLLSGGIDSALLCALIKKHSKKKNFVCVFAGVFDSVANLPEPKDYFVAKKVASFFGVDFVAKKVFLPEYEKDLVEIINLIESTNPVKVGVASTLYYALKEASNLGLEKVFLGFGADELFGGYNKFKSTKSINKESFNSLMKLSENELYYQYLLALNNNQELLLPFLDNELIKNAVFFDSKKKIVFDKKTNSFVNKKVLREFAQEVGVPKEFSFREKKAAQYGSGFDKALGVLSKKNGFKTKTSYLESLKNSSKRIVSKNFPVALLFSTGKDSLYSMYLMKQKGFDVKCAVLVNPQNKDSFMFQSPSLKIAKLQAKTMGLKLIIVQSKGIKEKELKELDEGIIIAKKMFGVKGVVSGTVLSTYQKNRIEGICKKNSLIHFAPLWKKNQLSYLNELVGNGFIAVISKVACLGLGEEWLGREINSDSIKELTKLNSKYGVSVSGEGGEYESIVLDSPLFEKRIGINFSKKMFSELSGEIIIGKARLLKKK